MRPSGKRRGPTKEVRQAVQEPPARSRVGTAAGAVAAWLSSLSSVSQSIRVVGLVARDLTRLVLCH